jgi:O-antigen ligase
LPYVLFVAAGLWGVLIALPQARDEAVREFRWLVFEPLLWYLLVTWCAAGMPCARLLATLSLVASGTVVALLGVAQFAGFDLVPLLGDKRSFSENVILADGVRRVASVYGHPNNLGLFLERVWPLAGVLALGVWRGTLAFPRWFGWLMAALACMLLAGIAVTFSRGAWIGAVVSGGILVLGLLGPRLRRGRVLLWMAGGALLAAALLGIAFGLRSEGGSANVRVLLWQEALGYLRQHPFGIGLDQFLAYHHPESGLSLIDPSLVGTSEMYAAHPHNVLLDIWLRMGPLGLLVFGWLVLRFVSSALNLVRGSVAEPLALGALAAMAAALTHGLVDHFYFVPDLAFTFWLLLSLVQPGRHRGRAGIIPATNQES